MSYAKMFLKCTFDYGSLRVKHPSLVQLNPDGTCFTMSCRWARELLDKPSSRPEDLAKLLENEIMNLAPIHEVYIKETSTNLPQQQRNGGYVKVFDAFHLKSPTLAGNSANDYVPGFNTDKVVDTTDWMGLDRGDMWGAVYRWSMKQTKPLAAILSDEKHSLGMFSNDDSIRIWDMNAGEFLVTGEPAWRLWSQQFEKFETGGGKGILKSISLIQVLRK